MDVDVCSLVAFPEGFGQCTTLFESMLLLLGILGFGFWKTNGEILITLSICACL